MNCTFTCMIDIFIKSISVIYIPIKLLSRNKGGKIYINEIQKDYDNNTREQISSITSSPDYCKIFISAPGIEVVSELAYYIYTTMFFSADENQINPLSVLNINGSYKAE